MLHWRSVKDQIVAVIRVEPLCVDFTHEVRPDGNSPVKPAGRSRSPVVATTFCLGDSDARHLLVPVGVFREGNPTGNRQFLPVLGGSAQISWRARLATAGSLSFVRRSLCQTSIH
jgi:hypothetical protein